MGRGLKNLEILLVRSLESGGLPLADSKAREGFLFSMNLKDAENKYIKQYKKQTSHAPKPLTKKKILAMLATGAELESKLKDWDTLIAWLGRKLLRKLMAEAGTKHHNVSLRYEVQRIVKQLKSLVKDSKLDYWSATKMQDLVNNIMYLCLTVARGISYQRSKEARNRILEISRDYNMLRKADFEKFKAETKRVLNYAPNRKYQDEHHKRFKILWDEEKNQQLAYGRLMQEYSQIFQADGFESYIVRFRVWNKDKMKTRK